MKTLLGHFLTLALALCCILAFMGIAETDASLLSESGKLSSAKKENMVTVPNTASGKINVSDKNNVDLSESAPVEPVGIDMPEALTLIMDFSNSLPLNAALVPQNAKGTISYESGNARIASVSADGVVTAVAPGSTQIVARAENGVFRVCAVTVVPAPTKVKLTAESTQVSIGETLTLTPLFTPAESNSNLKWTCEHPKVASVDQSGAVTGLKEGSAKISVSTGKVTASIWLEVIDSTKPTQIVLNQTGTVTLNIDKTLSIGYSLLPDTAVSDVIWLSSSDRVATVDENGLVTPLKEGTVTITAKTVKSSKMATVKIKVVDLYKPTKITLNQPRTVTLNMGETLPLDYTLEPAAAQSEVVWKSSDANIAVVSESGIVTPVKEGSAVITVKTVKNELSDKIRINVVDPFKPTRITLDQKDTLYLCTGDTHKLGYSLSPENAVSDVRFTSSSSNIVKVSSDGMITAVNSGTATITVTTLKNSKTDTVKVKVLSTKGITVDLENGYANLNNVTVHSLEELLVILKTMPTVTKVDMFSSRLSNESMDYLTENYPQIEFGWTIRIGDHEIRTDMTAFSTLHTPQEGLKYHTSEEFYGLKFCKNLEALDVGHNALTDISFLHYMPKMKVLILACNHITDLSVLSELKELEYIELFSNRFTDITPLAELTNLRDLNLCNNKISDLSALDNLTNLERFRLSMDDLLTNAQKAEFEEKHPNCFTGWKGEPTEGKWRQHPHYDTIYRIFHTRVYEPF